VTGSPGKRHVQQHRINSGPVRTKKIDRCGTIGSFIYLKASLTEHLYDSLPQLTLVFHNQNHAKLRSDSRLPNEPRHHLASRVYFGSRIWQQYLKGSTFARFARKIDSATETPHDPLYDSESKSASGRFGSEERVEYLGLRLGRHATTSVGDF